ncbi:hypothetical protein Tco_0810428 [Tanacetum coccineum]
MLSSTMSQGIPSYESSSFSAKTLAGACTIRRSFDYAYLLWEDCHFHRCEQNTEEGNAILYYPRSLRTIPPSRQTEARRKLITTNHSNRSLSLAPKETTSGKGKQKTTELETISEAEDFDRG